MGKITTIYLTDKENAELKKFCDENQCTQYSALKTALRELLNQPLIEREEENPTLQEDTNAKDSQDDVETEEDRQAETKKSGLLQLLRELEKT